MSSNTVVLRCLTALGVAAVCLAVSSWALARPGALAGEVWSEVRAARDAVVSWYVRGPVDARPDWQAMQMQVLNGDERRGQALIKEYGCGSCHSVPGVHGARGTVGPPLAHMADRAYIAGIMPNRPDNMVRWLVNPPRWAPETAMPDMGLGEAEATDITAYLYTLRDRG